MIEATVTTYFEYHNGFKGSSFMCFIINLNYVFNSEFILVVVLETMKQIEIQKIS